MKGFYKLFNSGSSAGAVKGWETKHAGGVRVLPSVNDSWGFHGTVGKQYDSSMSEKDWADAQREKAAHWEKMFKAVHPYVADLNGKPTDTRNFLDSTWGRHIADQVNSGHNHSDAIRHTFKVRSALDRAINGVKSGRENFK